MSGYASGTKLSELRLDGDPPPTTDVPAAAGGQPVAATRADQVAAPTSNSSAAKLSLSLTDAPAETVEVQSIEAVTRAAIANAGRASDARNADEYLAAATRELESGELDKPLWAKAMELASHDVEVAKPAYLRARATALRIAKQKKRAEAQAQRARELTQERREWPAARPVSRRPSRRVVLIGGALGASVIVLVMGFFVLRPADEPSKPTAGSTSATKTALPGAVKAAPVKSGAMERAAPSGEDFAKKVADLKSVGNWNVLVLYAVEWTRKMPESADAWNELSMGYVKLRQFSEALDAATKTVQLAPMNSQAWQTLGDVNVALDRAIPAISAYERAVALNSRDVSSLVQLGTLQAQFSHLPEARLAFAQALDVSPTDTDALCGAASVAQKEGRAKDAETFARQLKAADLRCREPVAAAPPPPAAAPPASKKPAPSTKR